MSLHSPERRDRGIVRVGRWGEAREKNKRNWGRGKRRNEKGFVPLIVFSLLSLFSGWVINMCLWWT